MGCTPKAGILAVNLAIQGHASRLLQGLHGYDSSSACPNETLMSSPLRYSTRVIAADAIESRDVAAWSALEARALEPNAYVSPHFILPAARHLTCGIAPKIFLVERDAEDVRQLVGVAVFRPAGATRRFPFRSLAAYRCEHSYLSGLLFDREFQPQALQALLDFVRDAMPQIKAIEIEGAWADGALVQALHANANRSDGAPHCAASVSRAILVPGDCEARLREDKELAPRVRDLNRKKRRLGEQGEVGWRWHRAAGVPDDALEAFLRLEHSGWKAEQGTSLRSKPNEEAFFREVVAGFASEGRALFTELTLGGRPIASSCNFISGRVGFGFKIGWDPQYHKVSPALLNELELMRNAARVVGDLEFLDSGAAPDSWIDKLWLSQRHVSTLWIPTRASGAHALRLVAWARRLKRAMRGIGATGVPGPAAERKLVEAAHGQAG
jgi:CelD/BcsL family acetyltransferase involved in cellulose biosynthesis